MGDPGDDPTAEPELAEFRSEVRAFANRLPEILADADNSIDRTRRFLAARYDAGLGALDYPEVDGGRDLDRHHVRAYREEIAACQWDLNQKDYKRKHETFLLIEYICVQK